MKTIIITKSRVRLPRRQKDSRKGDNGRVLVIGGSPEYIGAPALAGIAALRSGADSVVVAAPEKVAWAINCLSPDLVTKKLPGRFLSPRHFSALQKMAATADCVLIGGGVHPRPPSLALIKKFAGTFAGFKILDAAAITAFDRVKLRNAILTPNTCEYEHLQQYADIRQLVARGNIVVAKSWRTTIYSMHGTYENRTGNPGLTKAGTGDVLAGLIAGFTAQSKDQLQSAINAVYYLGLLGDALLKKKKGYFYLASDLAQETRRIKTEK
ncbi:MAG: NAD(P)H-hydrate dehydratase [Patescibacteria group bacterium]|nr:NAD(P)H-hydrate dehydratase [Patescibacteria group bacterium]